VKKFPQTPEKIGEEFFEKFSPNYATVAWKILKKRVLTDIKNITIILSLIFN